MQTRISQRALTEKQAAAYIGMSQSFLRQARCDGAREGRTPAPMHIRIGKRSIRYLIESLDEWLDAKARQCGSKSDSA